MIMIKSINNLMQINRNVKNLMKERNVITFIRLLRSTNNKIITGSKIQNQYTITNNNNFENSQNDKRVGNKWYECHNTNQLCELIQQHQNLNGYNAFLALNALFKLDKIQLNGSTELRSDIPHKQEFNFLCNVLQKNVHKLKIDHIITLLKILHHFRVPAEARIVQMLLQMIRDSLNYLSISQIIFINFILSRYDNTPLVQALSMALPLVLQTHLKARINVDNMQPLVNALEYVHTKQLDYSSINFVLTAINKLDESSISSDHAVRLIITLFKLNNSTEKYEILTKAQNVLIKAINDGSFCKVQELRKLLRIISERVKYIKHQDSASYNAQLVDACVKTFMAETPSIKSTINLLMSINIMNHEYTSILDYVSKKFSKNEIILTSISSQEAITVLTAMAIANYKPEGWESIKTVILTDEILGSLSSNALINLAYLLAALDLYWPKLLKEVFSFKYNQLTARSRRNLLVLHFAVENFYPQYNGPRLSCEDIKLFGPKTEYGHTQPLQASLECILGGSEYVMSSIKLPFGIVENLVIIRKGGYPVAFNAKEQIKDFRDIKSPPDSQLLIFKFIPRYYCIRNTGRLNGLNSFFLKTVEAYANCPVIHIYSTMWNALTEQEQLQHMSEIIRSKCNELSANAN